MGMSRIKGISRIKMTGLALAVSALGLSSTIQAQGTVQSCQPCGVNACSSSGCYSCNGTKEIGTYQQDEQTCTIFQTCNQNCPGSAGQCPSWSNPWVIPASCVLPG